MTEQHTQHHHDHHDHHDHDHDGHGHGHSHGHQVVRHCDVAVVGGSAAGLAAALQLSRQRRSVIVIDAGEPRNAPAASMHGYLGHEGAAPSELQQIARSEVRSYGAEVLDGRVEAVSVETVSVEEVGAEAVGIDGTPGERRFQVELVGGHRIVARRVLAATGLVDELPDIRGVRDHWGHGVIHCPFCHGYEIRDQQVIQVVSHPMGLHSTLLFRQLTDRLTVILHDLDEANLGDEIERLEAAGVEVLAGHVERVADIDEVVSGVELNGRGLLPAEVVVVSPTFRVRAEPFAAAGLTPTRHMSGIGDHLAVGPDGQTDVAGIYAAGNVTDPSHQVLNAAANGSLTGAMIAFDLATEDARLGHRPSGNAADWEHRYDGDQIWSGNPNGSLVAEVESLTAGRALDVGAGEGGDAVWLAENGWAVTANDISRRALDQIEAVAVELGLDIATHCADANSRNAFRPETYDLVSAQYAAIPRTSDQRGVRNLLGAVAPGGTLVVVSHDLEPMRQPIDNQRAKPGL